MFSFGHILSAVALILFGVRFLREGLGRILGPRLDELLQHLGGRPVRAFLVGLGLGTTVPSSTSVSLLMAQSLRNSRLTARQALPLMLGADIGITALVLVSSLDIGQAAPWLLSAGVAFYLFAHAARPVGGGQVLLGLGLVLWGVTQIGVIGRVVGANPDMVNLLRIADHYPFALALLSAAVAVALQSSTATILLIAHFAASGSLSLPLALFVVVGANVGIAITRMIVSWDSTEARRLAVMSLLNRLVVAGLVVAGCGLVAHQAAKLPVHFSMKVALLHLVFNITAAVLGAMLSGGLEAAAAAMVKGKASAEVTFGPRYISQAFTDTPSVALGQSLREIVRAAEIVREMLADLWRAMEQGDEAAARAVGERDDQVDLLDREVKRFLTQLATRGLDQELATEQMRQLRFLNEVEAIGDIVDKNLRELVLKKLHVRQFPAPAWRDLQSFFAKVQENMLIAEIAFQTRDVKLAAQLMRHKEWLNRYHRQLADQQLARLTHGTGELHEVSAVQLDLLANLKRINSCLSHVAYAVLTAGRESERADDSLTIQNLVAAPLSA